MPVRKKVWSFTKMGKNSLVIKKKKKNEDSKVFFNSRVKFCWFLKYFAENTSKGVFFFLNMAFSPSRLYEIISASNLLV